MIGGTVMEVRSGDRKTNRQTIPLGCVLSTPIGVHYSMGAGERAQSSRPTGQPGGRGLLARVLQHEIDHLDGILFVARIEDLTRLWRVSELTTAAEKEVAHI